MHENKLDLWKYEDREKNAAEIYMKILKNFITNISTMKAKSI